MSDIIPIVGIGADGMAGLSPRSLEVLKSSSAIYGSSRQLKLVAPLKIPTHTWPSPLLPALTDLADHIAKTHGVIIASGDPMFHGIGSTLARLIGPKRLQVYPAPSSISLAASRIGWPLSEVAVLSCVTADPHSVLQQAAPRERALVLVRDASTPVEIAQILSRAGWGESQLSVLSDLGANTESVFSDSASQIAQMSPTWSELCVVAITYETATVAMEHPTLPLLRTSRAPGLADECYSSDGQLTKRLPRAIALSLLAPRPHELLWDIGGGAGSIAIEWMRSCAQVRAICFERDSDRAITITENAYALGVPGIEVVCGHAPGVLRDRTDRPNAIFIGGGLTTPGMLDICWEKLREGGRLVAAGVTVESEILLAQWRARYGGELTRTSVESSGPLGGFTGWHPARSIVHLECHKPGQVCREGYPL